MPEEFSGIDFDGNFVQTLRTRSPTGLPSQRFVSELNVYSSALKSANGIVEDGGRGKWIVKDRTAPVLKPDVRKILHAGNFAHRTCHHGAFLSFTGDGCNAQQLTLGIGEKISEADGVIDVAADIGIPQGLHFHDFPDQASFVLDFVLRNK